MTLEDIDRRLRAIEDIEEIKGLKARYCSYCALLRPRISHSALQAQIIPVPGLPILLCGPTAIK